MTLQPYYEDESVSLYLGKFQDVLPELNITPDLVIADPPYQETSLDWDRWPTGWPGLMPGRSMWCFGSMRMFLDRRDEFADWKFSQDIVWEKHTGSGFATDRFKRVHEFATHWYQGSWDDVYHATPRLPGGDGNKRVIKRGHIPHTGKIGGGVGYEDDGFRFQRSVGWCWTRWLGRVPRWSRRGRQVDARLGSNGGSPSARRRSPRGCPSRR